MADWPNPVASAVAYAGATGLSADDVEAALDELVLERPYLVHASDYGATADGREVTDGAITTGTATLTSASGQFVVADVGKTVIVSGAGASAATLITTISGYTSATSVTLTANAGTTVSNATVNWGTNNATALQAAIDALPTTGPNPGGTLELGRGDYLIGGTLTILDSAAQTGIRLRGAGVAQASSFSDSTVPRGRHATRIVNCTTGDGIQVTGTVGAGADESKQLHGVVFEDFAVVGHLGSGNGITLNRAPRSTIRRVVCEHNGKWGVSIDDSYWIRLDQLYCLNNGSDAVAQTQKDCGGLILGPTAPVNALTGIDCIFNGNCPQGAWIGGGGEGVSFINTDFARSRTISEWRGFMYATGVTVDSTNPVSFWGCFFEANLTYEVYLQSAVVNCNLIGCRFQGNGACQYGVGGVADTIPITVIGCRFDGHTIMSVEDFANPQLVWIANQSSDPIATKDKAGGLSISTAAANRSMLTLGHSHGERVNTQTLAANGAVTINASLGDLHVVTLEANATSMSVTNPLPGQRLTVVLLQDATGNRTVVWPTNFTFQGSAPVDLDANGRVTVTVWYDGTNWHEQARSTDLDLATQAELAAHEADTTSVHGITDTANLLLKTLADVKGDLLVASAADTITRLAAGTDGFVLTANSATGTGLEWATAGGGGLTITEAFSGSETVGTTEHSLTTDTAGPDVQTDDGLYQFFFDVSALAKGDKFTFRVYEKVLSGGTQRVIHRAFLSHAQSEPIWVSQTLVLLHGWDATLQKTAGTDRSIDFSVRKVS